MAKKQMKKIKQAILDKIATKNSSESNSRKEHFYQSKNLSENQGMQPKQVYDAYTQLGNM